MVMSLSVPIGRLGKLHESGLTVQQLSPTLLIRDDERNNDDSGGASGLLFLDVFNFLCCVWVHMSNWMVLHKDLLIYTRVICAGSCVAELMQRWMWRYVQGCMRVCLCFSHGCRFKPRAGFVLTTESGKSCSEELNVPSSWTHRKWCVCVRVCVNTADRHM